MMQRIRAMRQDEGFTLIELLLVIVVLGVLAGVVVLSVGGVSDRGATAACRSDFKNIEVAQQAHYAKLNQYADGTAELVSGGFLASEPSPKGYTITTAAPGTKKSYTITVGPAAKVTGNSNVIAACNSFDGTNPV